MRLERFRARNVRRRRTLRPLVDQLEDRALLTPVNVLVNNRAEDSGGQNTQSETTLLTYTNGTGQNIVLSGFNDSGSFGVGNGQHFTGYAISTDGGATFTDMGTLPDTANGDAGDPVMARDNVLGRDYFATLDFTGATMPVFSSNDDGQTWSQPANAAPGFAGPFFDKQWMAVDNNPGAGQGNIYFVGRDFGSSNGIFFTKSTDHGLTFGPSGGLPIVSGNNGNVQGVNIVVAPDHSISVFYLDQSTSPNRIMMRRSVDGGNTFGAAATVTSLTSGGINGDLGLSPGFRTSTFPQAAVNPVNGDIYIVYDDKGVAANDKADVFLRFSTNHGRTWSAAMRVNNDNTTNDQWQPTLAVTPDGTRLGVFFYDRRNDPADNRIQRYAAFADLTATTVTFTGNYQISDASYAPVFGQDPVVNSVYMGDYDTTRADNNFFYNQWEDNRLGDQDVRFAKIATHVYGPVVNTVQVTGLVAPPIGNLRISFSGPINLSTLTPSQIVITDSNGANVPLRPVNPIVPVAGTNNSQFIVWFTTPVFHAGAYTVSVGPNIADLTGHIMDSNEDGTPGQVPGDAATSTFMIAGPQIVSSTPNGTTPSPVSTIQVTFNTPMQPLTFTNSEVTLTGPGGAIPIANITPVNGSNNTRFIIAFAPQSAGGIYQITIGPNILDTFGDPMDQNGNFIPGEIPGDEYVSSFSIISVVPYQSAVVPINFVELVGDPSAFTIITAADDSSVPVDLGSNTFTFYNNIYTGNNKLFVSSNGLISFGSANSEYSNQDMTSDPTQAAIAPYWDDLITGPGNPMVLGKFGTYLGAPALFIEWNQADHYFSTSSGITFEAVLFLNTGSTPANMYFEYPNLVFGDPTLDNGASATVGIKEVGTQGLNRLLVSLDNNSTPGVQTGQAVHIFLNSSPAPGPHLSGRPPLGGPPPTGTNPPVFITPWADPNGTPDARTAPYLNSQQRRKRGLI
jgi:hypothetical protein